tara:strand:- start:717 stop:1046 length:330 start_codon:yes stop_codon:yes gene_type:complete
MSSKSFMQHQREIDRDSDIELDMERIEQEAREAMSAMNKHMNMSGFDVLEAAYDLGSDEIELALSMLDRDPLEAVRILKEVRAKAVNDVIGRMDIRAMAEEEINRSEAA